ncbi:MAG: hypothetical protein QM589_17390 [Thermomicrobiales bacterium]
MYIPKSFLSRLLGMAWTLLVIAALLWLAVKLLAEVWISVVVIGAVVLLIKLGFWIWRFRRDEW